MKKTFLIAAASLFALVACGGPGGEMMEQSASKAAPPPPPPAPIMAEREMAFDEDGMGGAGNSPAEPEAQQYIAYTHSLGMRLPVESIQSVMDGHVAACNAAGPSKCIITNSWYNSYSEDEASASLQIRAVPEWIDTFLNQVDAEAEGANGEVTNRHTAAEDLTVTIIDTGARLRPSKPSRAGLKTCSPIAKENWETFSRLSVNSPA